MEEASINNDYDEETGTNTDIELTAIVLPDCGIRPLVGDFFACTSIKKNMELFFKVQEVEIGIANVIQEMETYFYKDTVDYTE